MSRARSLGRCGAVVLVAVASGCLIVPKTGKTEQRRYHHDSAPKPDGEAVPEIAARPHGPALEVHARWRRTCTIWRSHIVEYEVKRTAGMEGIGGCSGGEGCLVVAVIALALAPITLPVSGIATAISLSGEEPTTRREVDSRQAFQVACDAPGAGFRLRATRPGQPPVHVTTDAAGRARILHRGAGPIGTITIQADEPAGVRPVQVRLGPPGSR